MPLKQLIQKMLAHRAAWIAEFGEIPSGQYVLHKCDNPRCCNPAHLFLGTLQDNNEDRKNKGRNVLFSGELNGNAKLSEDTVRAIRESSLSSRKLAVQLGVSHTIVLYARRRDSWKTVQPTSEANDESH